MIEIKLRYNENELQLNRKKALYSSNVKKIALIEE